MINKWISILICQLTINGRWLQRYSFICSKSNAISDHQFNTPLSWAWHRRRFPPHRKPRSSEFTFLSTEITNSISGLCLLNHSTPAGLVQKCVLVYPSYNQLIKESIVHSDKVTLSCYRPISFGENKLSSGNSTTAQITHNTTDALI
jgi:hypothetical protein